MKKFVYWIVVLLVFVTPLHANDGCIENDIYEIIISLNQQLNDVEDPLDVLTNSYTKLAKICRKEAWWDSIESVYSAADKENILSWIYLGGSDLLSTYKDEDLPHLPTLVLFLVYHLGTIQPVGSPKTISFARNIYLTQKTLTGLNQLVSRLYAPITFLASKESIYGIYHLSICTSRPISIKFNPNVGFQVVFDKKVYGQFSIGGNR